jgi:ribosomal protein L37AE/L43A
VEINSTGLFVSAIIDIAMIYLCPFCGSQLANGLHDGVADCSNCHRVFNSSKYNKLLFGSWVMRKYPDIQVEKLMSMTKLDQSDAELIYSLVGQNLYTHDEFQKHLKDLGISNKIEV